jgi:site-specific DNA-methyltransferase (adenine-specific)
VTVVYERFGVTVHAGDCLDVLAELPDRSVHAVVTDPPYGLEFMGKEWDSFRLASARLRTRVDGRTNPAEGKSTISTPEAYVAGEPFQQWCRRWAAECLRVLKPGGHLLAFGGSRTWHRLTAAIEDAGFEIRDSIAWLYASGFPKSLDVSKAIDKAAGAEREVVGLSPHSRNRQASSYQADDNAHGYIGRAEGQRLATAPATEAAAQWSGWGTALKPAFEPIVVARKPLTATVAANVLEHGTGALNIDGCRVEATGRPQREVTPMRPAVAYGGTSLTGRVNGSLQSSRAAGTTDAGRWPSNVVLTHAATPDGVDLCGDGCAPGCPVASLDEQAGIRTSGANPTRRSSDKFRDSYGEFRGQEECIPARGAESGQASRFFPVLRFEAKAPASERPRVDGVAHPTVKPLALMRWLVRLVTPRGGVVLDPFLGSGTTAQAARAEGFRCIGIECDESYLPLIRARLDSAELDLFASLPLEDGEAS